MSEYDFEVETDSDGEVDIPDEVSEEEKDMTVRQRGVTKVFRGSSLQIFSSENGHLEVTEDYFEIQVSPWGSEEEYLIKAEFPEEKSEELQDKLEAHLEMEEEE